MSSTRVQLIQLDGSYYKLFQHLTPIASQLGKLHGHLVTLHIQLNKP